MAGIKPKLGSNIKRRNTIAMKSPGSVDEPKATPLTARASKNKNELKKIDIIHHSPNTGSASKPQVPKEPALKNSNTKLKPRLEGKFGFGLKAKPEPKIQKPMVSKTKSSPVLIKSIDHNKSISK